MTTGRTGKVRREALRQDVKHVGCAEGTNTQRLLHRTVMATGVQTAEQQLALASEGNCLNHFNQRRIQPICAGEMGINGSSATTINGHTCACKQAHDSFVPNTQHALASAAKKGGMRQKLYLAWHASQCGLAALSSAVMACSPHHDAAAVP